MGHCKVFNYLSQLVLLIMRHDLGVWGGGILFCISYCYSDIILKSKTCHSTFVHSMEDKANMRDVSFNDKLNVPSVNVIRVSFILASSFCILQE